MIAWNKRTIYKGPGLVSNTSGIVFVVYKRLHMSLALHITLVKKVILCSFCWLGIWRFCHFSSENGEIPYDLWKGGPWCSVVHCIMYFSSLQSFHYLQHAFLVRFYDQQCDLLVMVCRNSVFPKMTCHKILLSSRKLTLQRLMHLNYQKRLCLTVSWSNWNPYNKAGWPIMAPFILLVFCIVKNDLFDVENV